MWSLVLAVICVLICNCLYNIYWHPLSHFPGPKLAVIGPFLEFYYDVVKDGTFLWEIEKMHRKYGPIVRINTRELHILDPEYYSHIYVGNSRRVNKDASTVQAFSVPTSVAATIDHDHHRARRGYISRYFSKRSVNELEPIIRERIDRLCGRLEQALQRGEVISLDSAFSALTADIITSRLYGQHFDYLGIKDFKFAVQETFEGMSLVFHLSRFLPILMACLKRLPVAFIRMILPSAADLLTIREGIKHNVLASTQDSFQAVSGSIILSALRDPQIPAEERSIDRLLDEGTTIIFAGTETSARAMSVAMFHLLNSQSLLEKLRDELNTIQSSNTGGEWSLADLEALPFLTGVVNECLRLSFGAVGRLPRVATHDTLHYKQYPIPPGTPVSQSTYFVHTDRSIFPDPFIFDPERWINAAKCGFPLSKYLVSFSKGTRQCLGKNIAYAELYMAIAKIASTFDMELYNTTHEDIEVHHVRLVGYPRRIHGQLSGRGNVKVRVTKKLGGKTLGA